MEVKLLDFQVKEDDDNDFIIEMYGLNKERQSYCIHISDFKPFVYIKVSKQWSK